MPVSLPHKIERLTTVTRRRSAANVACWLLTAALAAAWLLGMLDYWFRYADLTSRWLSAAALLAGIAVALAWRLRSDEVTLTSLTMARRIQQRFEQLGDRLASAMEFAQQRADDPLAGSPAMRRAVVIQASLELDEIDLRPVIDRRPLRRGLMTLALVSLACLMTVRQDHMAAATALARLVVPWRHVDWPRRHELAFLNPPRRLVRGATFVAQLYDRNGVLPESVRITFRTRDERGWREDSQGMRRVGDFFVAQRRHVVTELEYRAVGGDDRHMPWQRLEVVEPIEIEQLQITAYPPRYTRLDPFVGGGHMTVLGGTELALSATVSSPIQSAALVLGDGSRIEAQVSSDARGLTISRQQWTATESTSYRLVTVGIDELESQPDTIWQLNVVEDQTPKIRFLAPSEDLFVAADAIVDVQLVASDDLALGTITLQHEHEDQGAPKTSTVRLFDGPQHRLSVAPGSLPQGETRRVGHQLQLQPLALSPGSQLSLSATAVDSRGGRGQARPPRRITILSPRQIEHRVWTSAERILQSLRDVRSRQEAALGATERLESVAAEGERLSDTYRQQLAAARALQRRVDRGLSREHGESWREVARLSSMLETNRIERGELRDQLDLIRATLQHLLDGPLPAVRQALVTAANTLPLAQQRAALRDASRAQQDCRETLSELIDKLANWSGRAQFSQQIARLGEAQRQLKNAVSEQLRRPTRDGATSTPAFDQAELGEFADAQQELALQLQRAAAEMAAVSKGRADAAAKRRIGQALRQIETSRTVADMHAAASEIRRQRLGRAGDLQSQVERRLQKALQALRAVTEELVDWQQLATKLTQCRRKQDEIHTQTRDVDAVPLAGSDSLSTQLVAELAARQGRLRDETQEVSRELHQVDVLRQVLDRVVVDMGAAALLLGRHETGRLTQRRQVSARRRLEAVLQAVSAPRQSASAPAPTEGKPQQPGSPQRIVELRLVRMLQADLNRRVQALASVPLADRGAEETRRWAELSREQAELSNFVEQILSHATATGHTSGTQAKTSE